MEGVHFNKIKTEAKKEPESGKPGILKRGNLNMKFLSGKDLALKIF